MRNKDAWTAYTDAFMALSAEEQARVLEQEVTPSTPNQQGAEHV